MPSDDFPTEKIKQLYNSRWAIETSFRKLKYTIGLSNFHSRESSEFILIMYWLQEDVGISIGIQVIKGIDMDAEKTFRVVRFPLSEDSFECVVTNLPSDDFPTEKIKQLYNDETA